MARQQAADLVAELAARSPGLVALAARLALSARAEPVLVRHIRLELGLPAQVEADLWFSPLVQGRAADWLDMAPDTAAALRRWLVDGVPASDGPVVQRLAPVRDLIRRLHAAAPRTIRLEDAILWDSLLPQAQALDAMELRLRPWVHAAAEGASGRDGLLRWFSAAAPRLPAPAARTDGYALLTFLTSIHLGGRRIADADWRPELIREAADLLPRPLQQGQRLRLWVALHAGGLSVRSEQAAGYEPIDLPRTDPLLLEVRPQSGPPQVESLRPRPEQRIENVGGDVSIATAAGERYRLRLDLADGPSTRREPPKLALGPPQPGKPSGLMLLHRELDDEGRFEPEPGPARILQPQTTDAAATFVQGLVIDPPQRVVAGPGDPNQAPAAFSESPRGGLTGYVYISAAKVDDRLARELNRQLIRAGFDVLLSEEIPLGQRMFFFDVSMEELRRARALIVLVTEAAAASLWIKDIVRIALEPSPQTGSVFPVVPIWVGSISIDRFPELSQYKGISIAADPADLVEKTPAILAALGIDPRPEIEIELGPWRRTDENDGAGARPTAILKRRIRAWPGAEARDQGAVELPCPFSADELEALDWYLARSLGSDRAEAFGIRAREVEAALPRWGKRLYDALDLDALRASLREHRPDVSQEAWALGIRLPQDGSGTDAGTPDLPWELIHDGREPLFASRGPVLRRRVARPDQTPTGLPAAGDGLRILLCNPRPHDEATWLAHRADYGIIRRMIDAAGQPRVELDLCNPPTLPELTRRLNEAQDSGRPYQVVHFDGHGVIRREGPMLVFEHDNGMAEWVHTRTLFDLLNDRPLPLLVLCCCFGGAIARVLTEQHATLGAAVGLSGEVSTLTAEAFVDGFYDGLFQGQAIAESVQSGRRRMLERPVRETALHAGELQDWAVPVLYQNAPDWRLVEPGERPVARSASPKRADAGFIGRDRELMIASRHLTGPARHLIIAGPRRIGKTALAHALGDWLKEIGGIEHVLTIDSASVRGIDTFTREMGRMIASATGSDERLSSSELARRLGNLRALIVLDGAEHWLEGPDRWADRRFGDWLDGLLESPGVHHCLITTECPLPLSRTIPRLDLPGLSDQDMAELIAATGRNRRLREPAAVFAFNQAVGGLPQLAMTLLDGGFDVDRFLSQLPNAWATALRRSNAAVDRALSDVEGQLKRLDGGTLESIAPLLLFHAVAGRDVVQALLEELGNGEADLRALCWPLMRAGLASWPNDAHWIELHPLLGATQVASKLALGDDAMRDAWLRVMTRLVDELYGRLRTDPAHALARVRHEQRNLVALAERDAHPATIARIDQLFRRAMGRRARRPLAEPLEESMARLETGKERFDADAVAAIHLSRINALLGVGEVEQASRAVEQLERLFLAADSTDEVPLGPASTAGVPADAAQSSLLAWCAGRCQAALGNGHAAIEYFQSALQPWAGSSPPKYAWLPLSARMHLADLRRRQGAMEEARAGYEETMSLLESADLPALRLGILERFALLDLLQGKPGAALERYRQAFEDPAAGGDPASECRLRHQAGLAQRAAGRFVDAEHELVTSLQIARRIEDNVGEVCTLIELGNLSALREQDRVAMAFYQQARPLAERLEITRPLERLLNNLGLLLLRRNRLDEAEDALRLALAMIESHEPKDEIWKTLDNLAQLHRVVGKQEEAAEDTLRATEHYLAYHRAAGPPATASAELAGHAHAMLNQGSANALSRKLRLRARDPATPDDQRRFIRALKRLLDGERAPRALVDEGLDYIDLAELIVLSERLGESSEPNPAGGSPEPTTAP